MEPNTVFQTTDQTKVPNPQPADHRLETKRILIYLAITFFFTYLTELLVIRPLINSTDQQVKPFAQLLIAGVMFFPALGVLLTRVITREGFRNSLLGLPNFKKKLPYYLFAWFGPSILTVVGCVLYFILRPDLFDPSLPALAKAYQNAGMEMSVSQLQTNLLIQAVTAALIGPLLNFINCFGEEWGWRGYLLPKMKGKLKLLPMLLVNGVIWGVWHAPLTALGHNYGIGYPGFPYTGILAMVVFCIVMGTIFSFITIKTNSCIPAIFAHAGINAIGPVGIYLTTNGGNPFLGPAPTGLIGGLGFIVTAIIFAVILMKDEKKLA